MRSTGAPAARGTHPVEPPEDEEPSPVELDADPVELLALELELKSELVPLPLELDAPEPALALAEELEARLEPLVPVALEVPLLAVVDVAPVEIEALECDVPDARPVVDDEAEPSAVPAA